MADAAEKTRPTRRRKAAKTTFEIYRDGETTTEISFLIKMVVVVRWFRSEIDERLRQAGHSATRMEALGAIINMRGSKSQRDLANRLKLEGATITRVIDMLSADGLVERKPDPKDRRINQLEVSPAGVVVLEQIFDIYDEMRAYLLEGIPEERMKDSIELFDLMLGRLATMPAAKGD